MSQHQKEMMTIDEFMFLYGLKRNRYYDEVKKFPWLATKISAKSVRITRENADRWVKAIQAAQKN